MTTAIEPDILCMDRGVRAMAGNGRTGKATKRDIDRLVAHCLTVGWTVRKHTHPKTKANWLS